MELNCNISNLYIFQEINFYNEKITIIGLGYVGLPLAIEFGKKYKVLGFDINQVRIEELNLLSDCTKEPNLKGLKML